MIRALKLRRKVSLGDFRQFKQFDNHEMVITFTDELSGLKGFVAIHSTKLGLALGGTRLQYYRSEADGLKDALSLSRAMSYKCALANLPYGGGKGVILLSKNYKRDDALKAYARMVENLKGLFKTGTDAGIDDKDVTYMGQHTRHMLGLTNADRGDLSTAKCAALGVSYAMKAALNELYKSDNLYGRRIAIKGIGKLGGELAKILHAAGANLLVADTNVAKSQQLARELPGINVLPTSEIHKQEVDIYSPCALGNEFQRKVIQELSCKIVAGGANNQLPNTKAGNQLHKRGIIYAPDYVANAGGLIYVADELESNGFDQARVLSRISEIQTTLADIFKRSSTQNLATYKIADTMANERIKSQKHD